MVVSREGIHTKGDTVQKRISTLAEAWHVDSYMATAVPINTLDLIGRPVTQVDGVTLRSIRRHHEWASLGATTHKDKRAPAFQNI